MPTLPHFIRKTALMLSPLLLLLGAYFYIDPFKVVRTYDVFYDPKQAWWVGLDADYTATCTYDRQYPRYRYDAIIFGNSRSRFYACDDWLQYLPGGSSPYHFDANGESLYAMMRKVQYVERQGHPLHHALFVIDRELLAQDKAATKHNNTIAPQLEGNTLLAQARLQIASLRAWFNLQFIYAYADASLTNEIKPYMMKRMLLCKPYDYYQPTNEERQTDVERRIAAGTYYDEPDIQAAFAGKQHPGEVSPPTIKAPQLEQLRTIRDVLQRQRTDYRIVVSPLYDQIKLHPQDLARLQEIFGVDRVFDYSGVNAITSDRHYFLEPFHYRTLAGRRILSEIYKPHLPFGK